MQKKRISASSLFTCNRWFTYVFGLFMCCVSGVGYMFSAIAPSLKERMGYTQYEINLVGTLANVGGNMGIFGSLFYNYFGTRPSCVLAGSFLFGGYFLIYCSSMKWFWSNYVLMGLFFMTMQNGASTAYTAALSTNIMNFSQQSRGIVVGTMASCIAISSAIFTSFYSYVFKKDLNPFLFFMSITAGSIPFISTIFMNKVDTSTKSGRPSLSTSAALANEDEWNSLAINQGASGVDDSDTETQAFLYESESYGTQITPTYISPPDLEGDVSSGQLQKVIITRDEIFREVNPIRMLMTLDFWLLFVVFFAGVGSSYVITNNLGSIVLSLGAKDGAQNIMVLLFSFFNCVGRIVTGILSDKLASYVTRMTLLNLSVLGIGLVHYGFSFATIPMMYPLIILLGLVYGALYAMIPTFISDRFGQKYFAINFNGVATIAPTIGSYVLATALASAIYKANSRDGSKRCYGRKCYQLTYTICTGVCLVAFVIGLVLMYRSRKMYDRINAYNKKNKNAAGGAVGH